MNITIEGLFLALLFVVPGFLYWQTSGLRRKVGDLTLTLLSAALTGAVLAVEGLIFVVTAEFVGAVDQALARVLEVGLLDYARERPKMVSAIVLGLPLLNAGILYQLGSTFTPPPLDTWPWLMEQGPDPNEPVTDLWRVATARLKTGESYRGFLAQWEPSPREKGGREFVLWYVSYRPSAAITSWRKLPEGDLGSVVLLNTSECKSVELAYVKKKRG